MPDADGYSYVVRHVDMGCTRCRVCAGVDWCAALKARGRIDNNQTLIVAGLRANGFSVIILSGQGDGCPDILVGGESEIRFEVTENLLCHAPFKSNILMEIKSKTGKLTPDQEIFKAEWKGQYDVVRSLNEALFLMGKRRD